MNKHKNAEKLVESLLKESPGVPPAGPTGREGLNTEDRTVPLTPEEISQLEQLASKYNPGHGAAPDGSEPAFFVDPANAFESNEISNETYEQSEGSEVYGFAVFGVDSGHAYVLKTVDGDWQATIGGDNEEDTKFPTLEAAFQHLVPTFDMLYAEAQAELEG